MGCYIQQSVFDVINLIPQQCQDLFNNQFTHIFIDLYILSNLFGCIKPLSAGFNDLLTNNEHFQNRISQSRNNFYQIKGCNKSSVQVSTSHMSYCWSSLNVTVGYPLVCFSVYTHFEESMKGRFAFFSEMLCKGDFESLISFMKSSKYDTSQLQDSRCMYGVFSMIAAFLRDDLLDNEKLYYVSPNIQGETQELEQGSKNGYYVESFSQALLFLIDPNMLTQLKDHLSSIMIPLTTQDLFEFDLLLNPRYHPLHRIKFLWKLCWSSHFLKQVYMMQQKSTHRGDQCHKDADLFM